MVLCIPFFSSIGWSLPSSILFLFKIRQHLAYEYSLSLESFVPIELTLPKILSG
jgi:hypothetical protein